MWNQFYRSYNYVSDYTSSSSEYENFDVTNETNTYEDANGTNYETEYKNDYYETYNYDESSGLEDYYIISDDSDYGRSLGKPIRYQLVILLNSTYAILKNTS